MLGKTDSKFPLPPCRVCDAPGTGFHYGVNTCEACKGFFHRSLKQWTKYKCLNKRNCVIQHGSGVLCRLCRYQRCLVMGMSKEAIKTGRYNYKKKTDDILEVKQLRTQQYGHVISNNGTTEDFRVPTPIGGSVNSSSGVDLSMAATTTIIGDPTRLPGAVMIKDIRGIGDYCAMDLTATSTGFSSMSTTKTTTTSSTLDATTTKECIRSEYKYPSCLLNKIEQVDVDHKFYGDREASTKIDHEMNGIDGGTVASNTILRRAHKNHYPRLLQALNKDGDGFNPMNSHSNNDCSCWVPDTPPYTAVEDISMLSTSPAIMLSSSSTSSSFSSSSSSSSSSSLLSSSSSSSSSPSSSTTTTTKTTTATKLLSPSSSSSSSSSLSSSYSSLPDLQSMACSSSRKEIISTSNCCDYDTTSTGRHCPSPLHPTAPSHRYYNPSSLARRESSPTCYSEQLYEGCASSFPPTPPAYNNNNNNNSNNNNNTNTMTSTPISKTQHKNTPIPQMPPLCYIPTGNPNDIFPPTTISKHKRTINRFDNTIEDPDCSPPKVSRPTYSPPIINDSYHYNQRSKPTPLYNNRTEPDRMQTTRHLNDCTFTFDKVKNEEQDPSASPDSCNKNTVQPDNDRGNPSTSFLSQILNSGRTRCLVKKHPTERVKEVFQTTNCELTTHIDSAFDDYESVLRRLVKADNTYVRPYFLAMSSEEVEKQDLDNTESAETRDDSNLETKIVKEPMSDLAKTMEDTIRVMVSFAMEIPGFEGLPKQLKVDLIKDSRQEFFLLNLFKYVDSNSTIHWDAHCGADCNTTHPGSVGSSSSDLFDDNRTTCLGSVFGVMNKFHSLDLTDEECVILKALAIMEPDRVNPSHINSSLVLSAIHNHLVNLLVSLLSKRSDPNPSPLVFLARINNLMTESRIKGERLSSQFKTWNMAAAADSLALLGHKPFSKLLLSGIYS